MKKLSSLFVLVSVLGGMLFQSVSAWAVGEIRLSPGMSVTLQVHETATVACGAERGGRGRGNDGRDGQGGNYPVDKNLLCSIERAPDQYGSIRYNVKAGADTLEVKSYLDDAIAVIQKLETQRLCLRETYPSAVCSVKRGPDQYGSTRYSVLIGSSVVEVKSYLDDASVILNKLRAEKLCR